MTLRLIQPQPPTRCATCHHKRIDHPAGTNCRTLGCKCREWRATVIPMQRQAPTDGDAA